MEASELQFVNYVVDIVVLNKDKKIVLLVEIKNPQIKINIAKEQLLSQLEIYWQIANKNQFLVINDDPFAMLVDLENIDIFRYKISKSRPSLQWLISFPTPNILSYYDAKFSSKQIFNLYMTTLVEAWLRDLAYHWKSEIPPGSQELADIGLLSQLVGGKTYSEVKIGVDTLH